MRYLMTAHHSLTIPINLNTIELAIFRGQNLILNARAHSYVGNYLTWLYNTLSNSTLAVLSMNGTNLFSQNSPAHLHLTGSTLTNRRGLHLGSGDDPHSIEAFDLSARFEDDMLYNAVAIDTPTIDASNNYFDIYRTITANAPITVREIGLFSSSSTTALPWANVLDVLPIEVPLDTDEANVFRYRLKFNEWTGIKAEVMRAIRATLTSVTVPDTSNTSRSFRTNSTIDLLSANAPLNMDEYGLIIGSSDQAFDRNDYNLISPYDNNEFKHINMLIAEPSIDNVANTGQIKMSRMFLNTSESAQTIREIGLAIMHTQNNWRFLFMRRVLDTPVTVQVGEVFGLTLLLGIET